MRYLLPGVFVLTLVCCSDRRVAEKVIIGRTWTADSLMPWAEGIAVDGDSIVAVGSEDDIREWIDENETEVIEFEDDQLVVPGFIDTHTHFIEGGMALSSVQLRDAKTKDEFINRIKTYAKSIPPGTWITSGDWDHENWGGELPTRQWIDSVTKNNPVWINRLDGHMNFANSLTLDLAHITNSVRDVAGGTIVRDKRGQLTGIFKDNAMELINPVVPPLTEQQEDRALDTAMSYVNSFGVTSVHNMSGFWSAFERAHHSKKLKVRIYAGTMLSNWKSLVDKIHSEGRGDDWLAIGNVKEFVDGSLGSHTAAFFEPFFDSPKDSGFFVISKELLFKRIKSADSAGLQVMVHAIGDRAIHTLLNIFDSVSRTNGDRDRRFRIEHAQHIHPNDITRFAQLNIIPSMQPYHAIDDGRWAEKVIGHERSKTTYAFKSLLDANARLVFGSDWFVAPPNPLFGIYAAVTRQTLDGKNQNGWIPGQKISVEQALRAYTIDAAYSSFHEGVKGSLKAGKLADITVLENDITQIDVASIKDVKVVMTMVGGSVVYKAGK